MITIRSKDDYLFVGPKGQQMVVNCLPLFTPRPDAMEAEGAMAGDKSTLSEAGHEGEREGKDVHSSMHEPQRQERRPTKAMRRFVLKKASSVENLLTSSSPANKPALSSHDMRSSEAEDILDASLRSSVKVQRSKWTHYNISQAPTNKVRNEKVKTKLGESKSLPETVPTEMTKEESTESEAGKGAESEGRDEVDGEGKEGQGTVQGTSFSDGGSDGEESRELTVSYIEDPQQVETLKRSSGSVSFIASQRTRVASTPPPSVAEDISETSEEKEEGADTGTVTGPEAVCERVRVVVESEGGESVGGESVTELESESEDRTDGEERVSTEPEEIGKEESEGDKPLSPEHKVNENEQPSQLQEKAEVAMEMSPPPSAPPPQAVPPDLVPQALPPPDHTTAQPTHSPLPPAPMTFEPEFIERSGWLMKLSHRRGQ